MARIPAYKAMNINNFDNIRRRLTSLSKTSSRSPSISSTTLSILYHKKIEINNDLLDKEFTEPVEVPNCHTKTTVEKVFMPVRQLTIVLPETNNMLQTRLWP